MAIAGGCLAVGEIIASNVLEDTLVKSKIDYYHKKTKHLTKLIKRMYVFKSDEKKWSN